MASHERIRHRKPQKTDSFEWQAFSTAGWYTGLADSPRFWFYGRETVLKMCRFSMDSINYTAFVLCYPFEQDLCNIFYTASLVDRKGNVHFSSKGRVKSGTGNVLMTVLSKYVTELLVERDLILRFKWFTNGECDKGFHRCKNSTIQESNNEFVESATQTIAPSIKDIYTNTEREERCFLDSLSNDLGNFYESKTDSDCVLKVGETKFHVHRCVLSARSNVFAAMFHHDTSERRSGEVDIRDVDVDTFGDVIYYIYTGKIRGLSSNTAASMYVVADKYCLIELREECLNFLMRHLTVENVCEAALLSHRHAEEKLENRVVKFFKERLKELIASDKWREFSDAHPKLANKLLCSILMASK